MEITQEQLETINNAFNQIVETFKRIYKIIAPIIKDMWKKIKKTLDKEITITKHVRKGKRYILKFYKTNLWKEFMINRQ